MTKFIDWNNYDNQDFYNALPVESFQEIAKIIGMDEFPDLKLIQAYLDKADSVIEIGAGYGRVIDYLIASCYKGMITGLEFCPKLYAFLQSKYQNKTIKLIKQDAHHLGGLSQADLILWLWSGIADFSPKEHLEILKQLICLLKPKGTLIIDTVPPSRKPTLMTREGKSPVFVQKYHDKTIHTYSLSNSEIDTYAKALNLKVNHLPYKTITGKSRCLHFFTKPLMGNADTAISK